MRVSAFAVALFCFVFIPAHAGDCKKISEVCVETGCKNISGMQICKNPPECWRYEKVYECIEPNFIDYCAPLRNYGCNETSSKCLETDYNGACIKFEKTYRCSAAINPQPSNTVRLDDAYTITEDRINTTACAANETNPTCTLAEKICKGPSPETRIINGLPVTKDCWEWDYKYVCLGPRQNNCQALEAKGCSFQGSTCVHTVNNVCQVTDRAYSCSIPGESRTVEDCSSQMFCVTNAGGMETCFDSGNPPDLDFAKVVAGMEVAREAGTYIDPNNFEIFKGFDNRCSIRLGGAFANCCEDEQSGAASNQTVLQDAAMAGLDAVKDYAFNKASNYVYDFMFSQDTGSMLSEMAVDAWQSGSWNPNFTPSIGMYGFSVSFGAAPAGSMVLGQAGGMTFGFDPYSFAFAVAMKIYSWAASCTPEDIMTMQKKGDPRLCHYVGTYCATEIVGACVEDKQTHCCFNSRLARIIHEQGRPQLGMSWGTPKSPSCRGFLPAELEALDWSRMDLSEFMAEIMANVRVPDASTTQGVADKNGAVINGAVSEGSTGFVERRMRQYYGQ